MTESPEVPEEEATVPVIDGDAEDQSQTSADIQQRLKDTGDTLKDASRRFGMMTARFAKKTSDEVSKAVDRTNQSIQTGIANAKERKEKRREEKINTLQEEISDDGIIETIPDMVDLPTPEEKEAERQEHIAMFEAQTQTQLSIIEELQRMSSRLDDLERRNRALATPLPAATEAPKQKQAAKRTEEGRIVTEALVVLGASLLWVVGILGIDQVINEQGLTTLGKVPLSPVVWAIGTSSWTMYILARIARVGPVLDAPQGLRIQTSLAVGITTLMALVFTDDTTSAMSDIWVWGTVGVVALMLTAGLIASAWRSTKRLVGFED
jgi:gas vesicle protein